jgi:predicted ArsR family transcriptional regulator
MTDDFATSVGGVSALAEPLRRELYLFVVAQPGAVSRDQAASGVGVARHTAKFHLDRLVDEGLLDTEYRRLSGRDGPGAGRPAKLYRRSGRQVSVSLPERRYDLAGRVLARAVDESGRDGTPVLEAVRRVAAALGRDVGQEAHQQWGGEERDVDAVGSALAAYGFEPRAEGDRTVLANCPFHALAREHTSLVCGMNVELVGGMLDGLGRADLVAELDPAPDRCCVTVRRVRREPGG